MKREIKNIPYNVLMFCIEEMADFIDSGDVRKLPPAKQVKIFSYLFGEFDANTGRITKAFDMSELSIDEAVEVLSQVQGQVLGFFTKWGAKTELLLAEQQKPAGAKLDELRLTGSTS